jgi:hypothetical protein
MMMLLVRALLGLVYDRTTLLQGWLLAVALTAPNRQ